MGKITDDTVIPITCWAYCFWEKSIVEWVNENDKSIPKLAVGWYKMSWKEAKSLGWSISNDIRFSSDGRNVFLCPDCTKRWKEENNWK